MKQKSRLGHRPQLFLIHIFEEPGTTRNLPQRNVWLKQTLVKENKTSAIVEVSISSKKRLASLEERVNSICWEVYLLCISGHALQQHGDKASLAPTSPTESTLESTLKTSSSSQANDALVKMSLDKIPHEQVMHQTNEGQILHAAKNVEGNTSEDYPSRDVAEIMAFRIHAIGILEAQLSQEKLEKVGCCPKEVEVVLAL